MLKIYTKFSYLRYLALGAILFLCVALKAQEKLSVPGAVSHLVINDNGDIKCTIHLNDQLALDHHESVASSIRSTNAAQSTTSNAKKGQTGADIQVDYFLLDPAFLPQVFDAIEAFQFAVDIWATKISSDQTIRVAAVFDELDEGVLGSAGPTFIFADVEGLERETWYGNALADKLAGEDLTPGVYDIVARFSTVFPNWYFGTDGNTPDDDFDFPFVVLHELGHGLGFFGSMFVDNATGIGLWGFGITNPLYPAIYDRLAHDENGKQLIKENKFANFSTELGSVLLDDPLVFRGPRISKVTEGEGARIFTTLDFPGFEGLWLPGSSYSHLDFFTYAGGPNGLMVPFLSRGLSLQDPGEITLAIFDDMGWNGKVNRPTLRENPLIEENTVFPVALYPNPVDGQFIVDLGDRAGELSGARLLDPLGREHHMDYSLYENGRKAIFTGLSPKLNPGVYMLQLQLQEDNKLLRFIKN